MKGNGKEFSCHPGQGDSWTVATPALTPSRLQGAGGGRVGRQRLNDRRKASEAENVLLGPKGTQFWSGALTPPHPTRRLKAEGQRSRVPPSKGELSY